jgi:meso-butanediol dehydrogenase/(S,S)-butanediol dehydrogenase/diacetyl reductase
MSKRLEGKTAVVTGAGQGVGRGIALALAAEGAAVVVAGKTESKLVDTCAEIERRGGLAVPVVCEVGKSDNIEACIRVTVETFARIDILVNNAQSVPLGRINDVSEKAFESGWRTGPLAAFRFMRACYPHLKDTRGVVVNLASGAALRTDPGGYGAYAAVKEAIRTLGRAAACEWGPDGIRVLSVIPLAMSPGMVMWTEMVPDEAHAFMETVPLRRGGDCEQDIGRAVAMLCSDDAAYITGTTIMLDGGQAYLR